MHKQSLTRLKTLLSDIFYHTLTHSPHIDKTVSKFIYTFHLCIKPYYDSLNNKTFVSCKMSKFSDI